MSSTRRWSARPWPSPSKSETSAWASGDRRCLGRWAGRGRGAAQPGLRRRTDPGRRRYPPAPRPSTTVRTGAHRWVGARAVSAARRAGDHRAASLPAAGCPRVRAGSVRRGDSARRRTVCPARHTGYPHGSAPAARRVATVTHFEPVALRISWHPRSRAGRPHGRAARRRTGAVTPQHPRRVIRDRSAARRQVLQAVPHAVTDVNFSSAASFNVDARTSPVYSAAKAGVNAVAPGFTLSKKTKRCRRKCWPSCPAAAMSETKFSSLFFRCSPSGQRPPPPHGDQS
jgi:hypothetical protein